MRKRQTVDWMFRALGIGLSVSEDLHFQVWTPKRAYCFRQQELANAHPHPTPCAQRFSENNLSNMHLSEAFLLE